MKARYNNRLRIFLLSAAISLVAISTLGALDAMINVPIACVRTEPRHSAELATQATFSTPVKADFPVDGWSKVTLPDGYTGYIIDNALEFVDTAMLNRWRNSPKVMVDVHTGELLETLLRLRLSDTHLGDIFAVNLEYDNADGYKAVTLPDSTVALIPTADVVSLDLVNQLRRYPNHARESVLANAASMMGQAYLWGGTSAIANDCSGFTRVCYQPVGILLPRDASQQVSEGLVVPSLEEALPGDLLFFSSPSGRINHVGIYCGDGLMIHCSGKVRFDLVGKHTDLDSKYIPIAIRRYLPDDGSDIPGVTYFDQSPYYTTAPQ